MGYVAARATRPGGGTVGLWHPAGDDGLPDWFRRFAAEAPTPSPPEILELEDVILGDGRETACLYDRDRRRIDVAALVRFDETFAPRFWRAAPTLAPSKPAPTIAEPVLFGGVFFNHWGHFLLESAARAWAAEGPLAGLRVVHAWRPAAPLAPIAAWFAAAGLRSAETGSVRLAKCFVPTAAFAHEGYADPRLLRAHHAVARNLWRPAARDARPVYFSRGAVGSPVPGRRPVVNEAELEARLAERGARIVHMQTLALAEQVAVINTHRRFIGLWGSALHNTLFSLDADALSTFTLLDDGRRPANFALLDALVGADAHYLATVRRVGDALRIDVDATLACLADSGAL